MSDKKTVTRYGTQDSLSEEQKRLWQQVEVIQRDIEFRPSGQAAKRSPDGVDKKTGEPIKYKDWKARKDDLLRDDKGRVLAPEEFIMLKESWGRTVAEQPKDGTWKFNANIGIRTRGDDALNIVLVETKRNPPLGKEDQFGKPWREGEDRRWEYQISRKGTDATKPENVLKIPVMNAFGPGLFADIGNAGSTYTTRNYTGKNFQPQKVTRSADNIEIIMPPPAGMGVALAIVDRDPFEAFAGKKAIRGGTIVVPDNSTEHVIKGYRSVVASLAGPGDNWAEISLTGGIEDDGATQKAREGTLYAAPAMPQDELKWIEKNHDPRVQKRMQYLNVAPIDAGSVIPEGASITIEGNTGNGATIKINDKTIAIPPHSSGNGYNAWNSPPVWLQGPGNKGTIDIGGLDGRIVIGGGGTIVTSQKPIKNWWYSDVILAGGSKDKKAVYTIEIPQFEDEKLKLDFLGKTGGREFRLERYPMPPESTIPLVYPDGKTVNKQQTENDLISIRGDHIEVRVKEGDKVRTVYDSDKPEINKQSGVFRQNGLSFGGLVIAAATAQEANAPQHHSRRQFLGATAAGAAAVMSGMFSTDDSASSPAISIQESLIRAPDPASATLEELMPDICPKPNGRSTVLARPAERGSGRESASGIHRV